MNNPVVIGIISWLLPGVGHFLQGRIKRGVIILLVVWAMFTVAVLSGGAYYPGFEFKDGALLYLLNIFAKLGNGLGAIINFVLMNDPPPNVAAWATFEYGGRFLEIAGLLNYLAVLDAIDIQQGEKMIHFLYLVGFAFFVAVAFGVFAAGSNKEKIFYGLKIFGQFLLVSLVLAWVFYFLPW